MIWIETDKRLKKQTNKQNRGKIANERLYFSLPSRIYLVLRVQMQLLKPQKYLVFVISKSCVKATKCLRQWLFNSVTLTAQFSPMDSF